MKYLIALLLITSGIYSQQNPNDCVNFIQACSNQDISLDVSGAGIQEITSGLTCNSNEHNSLWLRVTIETAGTLGFILTPESTNIREDYDFWVFGPNNACDNLQSAIRCSTTNPLAAGQTDNLTGMNSTETDVSEGPGSDGNSFVSWLTVLAGESYFIVIDRPIGDSAFSLTWTGSAIISNPFTFVEFNPSGYPDQRLCDSNFDGMAEIDFSTLDLDYLNGNLGFAVTYFASINDATLNQNPIIGLQAVQAGTYYARITDPVSKCFEIDTVEIILNDITVEPQQINLCDFDDDGTVDVNFNDYNYTINPNGNYTFSYFNHLNDAELNINTIPNPNTATHGQQFFVRATNDEGCFGVGEITINISEAIITNPYFEEICDDDFDGSLGVNLNDYSAFVYTGTQTLTTRFYQSMIDANNEENEIQNASNFTINNNSEVFIRFDNSGCYSINFVRFSLLEKPNLGETETLYICPDDPGVLLSVTDVYESYLWNNMLSNTHEYFATEVGQYTVTASTDEGCTSTKLFNVELDHIPLIEFVSILNQDATILHSENNQVLYSIDNGMSWEPFSTFKDLTKGVYQAKIRLLNGCISESFEFIILEFSNSITPNNDGVNDGWNIDFLDKYETAIVKIYDRYGKEILNQDVILPFKWNGKYLGRNLPTDVYWYEIILPTNQNLKGYILVKNIN